MGVEVSNETQWNIDTDLFADLARHDMHSMRIDADSDLSVTFVDPEEIADLHVQWLGLLGPTDVMSFPMDELRPGALPAAQAGEELPSGILGDIVICPDVAQRQAIAAGHSTTEEMMLLETHGILHLLGFDHASRADERRMFGLQRQLLLAFVTKQGDQIHESVLPAGCVDKLAEYYARHADDEAGALVEHPEDASSEDAVREGDC